MQATSQKSDPQLHLWTRAEYHQMAEAGIFQNRRVQLIEGQVVEMSPVAEAGRSPLTSRHAAAIDLVVEIFRQSLGMGTYIRQQKPLILSEISEPEPDIAVVRGSIRDYTQQHPTEALLVLEVSDSTLRYDQQIKSSLYAKAGLTEYWIVNLVNDLLEVYRDPSQDSESVYGFSYSSKLVLTSQDSIVPLNFPDVVIQVRDLLP